MQPTKQTREQTQAMVQKEFRSMCKGTLALAVVTALALCLCKQEIIPVVLGVVLGSGYTLFNFHSICRNAVQATAYAEEHLATRKVQKGYAMRYLLTAVCIGLAVWSKQVHVAAVVIPLFYPKIILLVRQLAEPYFQRKEDFE